MSSKKRLGLPKPDRSHPGLWIPITREEQPEAFRTSQEQAQADVGYAQSVTRLNALQHAAAARRTRATTAVHYDETEGTDTLTDTENDGDSSYEPAPSRRRSSALWPKRRKIGQTRAANAEEAESEVEHEFEDDDLDESSTDDQEEGADLMPPADALDIRDQGWKVGYPKSQPLTYAVPTAGGGRRWRTIKFEVDFNDKVSVAKANKRRHLARGRANKKAGGELFRPSTKGREFTRENDDWILAEYERYAAANNDSRISLSELTARYNARFPLQRRSQTSLTSHMDRRKDPKAKRACYKP